LHDIGFMPWIDKGFYKTYDVIDFICQINVTFIFFYFCYFTLLKRVTILFILNNKSFKKFDRYYDFKYNAFEIYNIIFQKKVNNWKKQNQI
jgi:hypothetical protein